jgi:hypothetical protein
LHGTACKKCEIGAFVNSEHCRLRGGDNNTSIVERV